jgi:hypothetical protein
MIKKWLKDIKEERPLWLAECRAESAENADSHEVGIDVISLEGENRSFKIALPQVETAEEIGLMTRFLDANRVNAAMLLGQMDDTDCAMPPAAAVLKQLRGGQAPAAGDAAKKAEDAIKDKLICSVIVGGNDIKLAIAGAGGIRKVLAYDWNPKIATEEAMITNPVFELCEMAKNFAGEFDAISVSVSDSVRRNKLFEGADVYKKLAELLKPLCKAEGTVKAVSQGQLAAFTVYNELARSDAADKLLEGGVIAINLDDDLEIGMTDENGNISPLPLDLADCILRIDTENDKFPTQSEFLKTAKMPDTNPKPCYDLLYQMAEGGDKNSETLFMDLGNYLGHAVREFIYFVQPKTNRFFFTGKLAENDLAFDMIAIGMSKAAPDVDFIQIDKSLANSDLMRSLSKNEATPTAAFAAVIGALYYALV